MPVEGVSEVVDLTADEPVNGGFHELAQQLARQLARQHDKEVSRLHREIENLRNTLAVSKAQQLTLPDKELAEANTLRIAASAAPPPQAKIASSDPPEFPQTLQGGHTGTARLTLGPQVDIQDTSDVIQGFELKGAWTTVPVASGSWGQELDKIMVDSQAQHLVDSQVVVHVSKGENAATDSEAKRPISLANIRNRLLINPASSYRMAWDLIGMLLICFDMLSIPIMIAFEPEEHWFSTGMGWVTLIFWTMDVVSSLLTGFYKDGKLVMKQGQIILNYLKGWFWIDMIVVVPDWTMKIMGSVTNIAGLGRILRIARIMRVLRMLRLLKLKTLLAKMYDLIDSEYMWIVLSLVKLLTILLVMNHVVACAWFLVGRFSMNQGYPKNWLEDSGHTPVFGEPLHWQYLTSLHWSITQFTPASMDISATNSVERLFSIAILFWALVALSSVIGNVSASMTALRNMSSDEMQKFWMLRRYFKQKEISRDLAERIIKYLEYECSAKKDVVVDTKVSLLKLVSETLKLELAHEMHGPLLICHPFFLYVETEIPAMMFRICHLVLKSVLYATDDVAFLGGDEGLNMYFFKLGLFEYKLVDGNVIDAKLGPKTWASEAVLWTAWRHRGSLTALTPSEVTEIRPGPFVEVFRMHPRPWKMGRQYGAQFVEYMNRINRTALTDVIFDQDIFMKLLVDAGGTVPPPSDPKSPKHTGILSKSKMTMGRDPVERSGSQGKSTAWA